MGIHRENLKRLASLSLLGAGALEVTGAAQASSIIYSGILDKKIGVSPGYGKMFTLSGPGGAGAVLRFFSFCSCGSSSAELIRDVKLSHNRGAHGTDFRMLVNSHGVAAEPRGAIWRKNFHGKSGPTAYVATWFSISTRKHPYSSTNFTDKDRYLLFRFTEGALPRDLYGWIDLSVHFTKSRKGPDVTLVSWAYDDSGAQIRAGDTGQPPAGERPTPEPATLALSGLAALALGARGLRNWRKSRVPAEGR